MAGLQKILTEDEIVIAETKRLQTFYVLKRIIRYHHTREEVIDTESTAEHIFGMMNLSQYFLPLEDPSYDWDRQKIADMILYHDIDEVETGDTIDYLKTEHTLEDAAAEQVIARLPKTMQARVCELLTEYTAQSSPEAKFVKAIDKFEPMIHLFNENGKKLLLAHGTTLSQNWSIKREPIKPFPYLYRFTEVLSKEMERQGYFTPEPKT